jgi:hypothetical protein
MDKNRLLSWHIPDLFLTIINFVSDTEMARIRRKSTEFGHKNSLELAFTRLVSRLNLLYVLRMVLSQLDTTFGSQAAFLQAWGFHLSNSAMWLLRRISETKLVV